MSKPWIHSVSSSKKWGGTPDDYLKVHNWFDQTKAHYPTNAHRAILHSSFGIFLCEQVFGVNITNSDNKLISVRDIGEQHILEDLGFIPTVSDYLQHLDYQDWMHGKGLPPSLDKKKKENIIPNFVPNTYPIAPLVNPNIPDDNIEVPYFDRNRIID